MDLKHHGPKIAYAILVLAIAGVFWNQENERLDEVARECIRSYEVREDLRDAMESAIRGSTTAILRTVEATGGSTKPESLVVYQAETDLAVLETRSQIPEPECNLKDARTRL